jgi:hypothetical protein
VCIEVNPAGVEPASSVGARLVEIDPPFAPGPIDRVGDSRNKPFRRGVWMLASVR